MNDTVEDLLAKHNQLAKDMGKKPLKTWKNGKDKLRARIDAMYDEAIDGPDPKPAAKKTPKKTTKKQKKAAKPAAEDKRTIVQKSIELLCEVSYYEDKMKKAGEDNQSDDPKAFGANTRSVGLPYDEIIATIRDEFSDRDKPVETSVACLRWYAVKIRAEELGYEGHTLPQRRPRAKAKKREG